MFSCGFGADCFRIMNVLNCFLGENEIKLWFGKEKSRLCFFLNSFHSFKNIKEVSVPL